MKNPKLKLKDIYNALHKPLREQEEEQEAPKSHIPQAAKQIPKDKGYEFKEEKVEIDIPGVDGKTKVKIEHRDVMTDKSLEGVTITFMYGAEDDVPGVTSDDEGDEVEKYTDVDFTAGEKIEDHGEEGQDWIFIAEGDDSVTFEVDVAVEKDYENSGNIQQIDWDTLTVIYADEGESLNEQGPRPDYADVDGDGDEKESMKKAFQDKEKMDEYGCSEKEIEEGTCGYAPDGDIDPYNTDELEPAGPDLVISLEEQFQIRAGIIK